jgi:hypothetical protein
MNTETPKMLCPSYCLHSFFSCTFLGTLLSVVRVVMAAVVTFDQA